jgi:hypothetical protein
MQSQPAFSNSGIGAIVSPYHLFGNTCLVDRHENREVLTGVADLPRRYASDNTG